MSSSRAPTNPCSSPSGSPGDWDRRPSAFSMEWSAVSLLVLAAIAWLWFDSMRARERAVAAGQNACARERLQFLDETVECTSIRPVRDGNGQLVLRRVYRFEFSD